MRQFLAIATALIVASGSLLTASPSHAQSKGEIVIGVQCDRTGPTQIVGTVYCPGFHDYVALINSKGGVEGFKIKAVNAAFDTVRFAGKAFDIDAVGATFRAFDVDAEVLEQRLVLGIGH